MTRYWINTVSLEHVRRGVARGYTQADHGRDNRLRQLQPGDQIAFYSPRTAMRSGEPLREFTALGTVTGEKTYQVEMSPDLHSWRLEVAFEEVSAAPIKPLLEPLAFITDPKKWGFPFRRGLFDSRSPTWK